MTGRYGSLDYERITKLGTLAGLLVFALGAVGATAGHAYFEPMPGWEDALFFDLELLGISAVLLFPIVFGVLLPLTE